MHSRFCHRLRTDRVLHRRRILTSHVIYGAYTKSSFAGNSSITAVGHSGTTDSRAVPDLAAASRANPAELPGAFVWRFPTGINSELVQCDDRLHSYRSTRRPVHPRRHWWRADNLLWRLRSAWWRYEPHSKGRNSDKSRSGNLHGWHTLNPDRDWDQRRRETDSL